MICTAYLTLGVLAYGADPGMLSPMAVRLKAKWHRSRRDRNKAGSAREKTTAELAGVLAFNIWKISHEIFRRMEKEGFRFLHDEQVTVTITEFIAFLVHVVDRQIQGFWTDDKRQEFINALAHQLTTNMVENQTELLGPGDYYDPMIQTLNSRFDEYADCEFKEDGPSFEARRFLALKISETLAETDNRWVIEQVMDIEVPYALDMVMRLARDSLGLK